MNTAVLYFVTRRKGFVPKVKAFIKLVISAFDSATHEVLTRLWAYVNGTKYTTDTIYINTRIKYDKFSTIKTYAPPTESWPYFGIPELYHVKPTQIKSNTFNILLTATDEQDNPLQYADVTVQYDSTSDTYQTDENGQVLLQNLPRDTDILITITKDDYVQYTMIKYK